MKGKGPHIEATYTNPAHVSGHTFGVSKAWYIDGSRLVSSVGEEITFQPGEKPGGRPRK